MIELYGETGVHRRHLMTIWAKRHLLEKGEGRDGVPLLPCRRGKQVRGRHGHGRIAMPNKPSAHAKRRSGGTQECISDPERRSLRASHLARRNTAMGTMQLGDHSPLPLCQRASTEAPAPALAGAALRRAESSGR